jgi:hypothetical protein
MPPQEIRLEVRQFVEAGPLPSEDAEQAAIDDALQRLERISRPVTDDEAQILATCFGPDDCFGLAWTLLHLIESAPRAANASYVGGGPSYWVDLLNERVARSKGND